jgi:photosystem II stability/assembly factor-like uncharacterized protein
MSHLAVLIAIFLGSWSSAHAQWTLQTSNTTADLRGIYSVGNGVAWASGTNGAVLRTEDGGYVWQSCAIPSGADHLDFRGIQAFDANTAIVMSSGKGDLSRLYKTIDGCHTWKLLLTNPYSPDGFFDAILFLDSEDGLLFGDPSPSSPKTPAEIGGDFRLRITHDGGNTWGPISDPIAVPGPEPGKGLHPFPDESAFAASNSSMASRDGWFWFATSASRVAFRRLYKEPHPRSLPLLAGCGGAIDPVSRLCSQPWTDFQNSTAPVNHSSPSSGIFSIWFATASLGIAVGGDHTKPEDITATAAYTNDGAKTWHASVISPHGYRSSVAYDSATKTWITVGPNGTDISTDDGKNWRPLHPDPAAHDAPGADRNWNAISLPFVVGPHGRIGKLNPAAVNR